MRNEQKDELYMPELPPVDLPYLVAVLFEVGPVMAGAMGMLPLDEQELAAWQSNTGIELQPWESRMIKVLSRDYLSESSRATKPDWPPVWSPVTAAVVETKADIAKKIRAILRA